jgi:hypothetical protein
MVHSELGILTSSPLDLCTLFTMSGGVDVSYASLQAHGIVNVALYREYSPGIVFIFSHGRKDISLQEK